MRPPTPNRLEDELTFRLAEPDDIKTCFEIETVAFPPDEAASFESLQYRQANAGDFFLVAIYQGQLIGFINSTRCHEFTHDSMSVHVDDGALLAIHGVVVHQDFRRRGVATQMLKHYVHRAHEKREVKSMVLLAKAHLLTFYIHCGFSVLRPSPIVHGADLWYDLSLDLDPVRGHQCYIVDAFCNPSSPAGTGNPAGVVICEESIDVNTESVKTWMQTTAAELKHAETAFVWPKTASTAKDGSELHYNIRFYTPTEEEKLCGHATLATAAALSNELQLTKEQTIVFTASQNILRTRLNGDSKPFVTPISMTFPQNPPIPVPDVQLPEIANMLHQGLSLSSPPTVLYAGFSSFIGDLLVEVPLYEFQSIGTLKAAPFLACSHLYTRGIIVSAVDDNAGSPYCFVSRFIGPRDDPIEDHVTGSAHTVSAPYYAEKLQKKKLLAWQDSPRGGEVECEVLPDNTINLAGWAATVMSGRLFSSY